MSCGKISENKFGARCTPNESLHPKTSTMNQPFLRRSAKVILPSIHNRNHHVKLYRRQMRASLVVLRSSSSQPSSSLGHRSNTKATNSSPSLSSLLELSKARLSLLVVTTTSLGFLSAGPSFLLLPSNASTFLSVTLGTALCSASAASLNQIIEMPRDARMKRTRTRPLIGDTPALTKSQALTWASLTGGMGGVILYHGTDVLTTVLGVGNIALYAGVYTHMKPRSEWNTWVGAVVGAVPPVMGYTAAVSAGTSSIATCTSLMELAEPAFLGTTLFLWQFPHFFALNWMYREDYKRGGFAMVSSNDPDGSRTASLITRYTFYLSSLPVLSSVMEVTSPMFAVEGVVLNAYALHVARRFDKERSNANARKVFLTSLWYLPCLLTLFLFHSRKWHEKENDDTRKSKDEGGAFLLEEVKNSGDGERSLFA
jgi:protoheme IX farnesyltransferase